MHKQKKPGSEECAPVVCLLQLNTHMKCQAAAAAELSSSIIVLKCDERERDFGGIRMANGELEWKQVCRLI